MPEGKKSFIIYHDYREPLNLLTDEQRGRLLIALLDYSEHGIVPEFDEGALLMAFSFIRQTLDRDAATWEETRKKRADAGRMGAEVTNGKRRQMSANGGNAENESANSAVNGNAYATATGNGNVNADGRERIADKPPSHFTPPSMDEVEQYANEAGLMLDAGAFCDYYAARGWRAGNVPILDWKAAVRTWVRRDEKQTKGAGESKPPRDDLALAERLFGSDAGE